MLHLLAMARAAGVDLELNDFQAISDRTPFLADLKPSGRFVMEDVHKVCSLQRLSDFILLLSRVVMTAEGEVSLIPSLLPVFKRCALSCLCSAS